MRTWSSKTSASLRMVTSRFPAQEICRTWNWFLQNFRSSPRFEERVLLSSIAWRCWTNTECWFTQIAKVNKFEKWSCWTSNRSCQMRIVRVLPSRCLWSTTQESSKRLSIKVSESLGWLRTVSIRICREPITRAKCFRALLNRRPSAVWTSTLVPNRWPSRDAACSSSPCQTLTTVLSSMIRNWRNLIRLIISRASSRWTNSVYRTSSSATTSILTMVLS